MRWIAALGLALTITVALLAVGVPGSAVAMELCSAAEEPCAEKNVQGEGTVMKGTSSEASFSTGLGTVTCKESTVEAETSVEAGSPLPAYVNALTFASCATGKAECTVTATNTPYYGLMELTGTEAASYTVSKEAAGNPAFSVKCGFVISCTFGAGEMAMAIEGGEPATIKASSVSLGEKSGLICPKEGTASWTASYKLSAPAQDRLRPVTTKLCKAHPNGTGGCEVESRYSGAVESELVNGTKAEFISTSDATKKILCEEAPLNGESFANDGTGGKIEVMKFESAGTCSSTFTSEPTVAVTVEGLPFIRSSFSFKTASRAILTVTGPSPILKFVVEEAEPITCRYRSTRESWIAFAYDPMKVKSAWQGTRIAGMAPCPVQLKLQSESIVTLPGGAPLWITK